MIVVSFGAGTNSTALLVGMHERGERPDAILFADTGAERPDTYAHLAAVNRWCEKAGFPQIVTVKSPTVTLYEDCINRGALPSVAYGFKTCSLRWKKEPQDKWLRNNGMSDATRLIGIDADESHRAGDYPNTRYPLIEWGWGRDECVAAIARAGICQPGKSSCFFCPSMRKHEIRALAHTHPELIERALKIEANAQLTHVAGLGRSFAWRDLLATPDLFPDDYHSVSEPCGCYDGEAA